MYSNRLSFYKESLDNETDNYIHRRSLAEGTSVIEVLRTLTAEVEDTLQRTISITASDPDLNKIVKQFLMVGL